MYAIHIGTWILLRALILINLWFNVDSTSTILKTHVAFISSIEVTHVGDIDLECTLYLLVLCEDGLDRVIVVFHGCDNSRAKREVRKSRVACRA